MVERKLIQKDSFDDPTPSGSNPNYRNMPYDDAARGQFPTPGAGVTPGGPSPL